MDNTEINAMLSELFNRLREEERDLALLSKDVKVLSDALKAHAEEEMEKYDSIKSDVVNISKEIGVFKRMLWILIGVFAAQNEMVMQLVSKLFLMGA